MFDSKYNEIAVVNSGVGFTEAEVNMDKVHCCGPQGCGKVVEGKRVCVGAACPAYVKLYTALVSPKGKRVPYTNYNGEHLSRLIDYKGYTYQDIFGCSHVASHAKLNCIYLGLDRKL